MTNYSQKLTYWLHLCPFFYISYSLSCHLMVFCRNLHIQDKLKCLRFPESRCNRGIVLLLFTEIANCEADIVFFAERHDEDTRQWLLKDFDKWFSDPGDSRAYVLLGDPGVGKSVMAGVLAQRSKKAGNLGAAYFCRHNDGTRNHPRYLLGTIACQLCKCNSQYNSIVGGEGGVRKLLGNTNLGVQELFTKLLQEPLGECNSFQQRKLVIIDALDETQYESRDDFLDLIMNRFPMLPKWLVFFITSRPEDTVQFRLKKYNPCIKICAGNSEHLNVYQQHERDIKLFLENSVDFSHISYSVEDITKKCNGLFLYAFYIAEVLKDPVHSGRIDQLDDLFPGDIDNFFLQNFKRVFDKVGANLYQKLFGCAIVAPSPLPLSFISFILKRENLVLDEQEVIDAVSQFVVLRTSDQTFTFLHNLIPTWLTDKKKASHKLFIDRIKAGEYFRDIIVEFLSAGVVNQRWEKPPSIEADLFDYCFRVGVRFLCEYREEHSLKIVYSCLTSYQFIWKRIQNNGIEIYSVIADFKVATGCQSITNVEREVLQEMCLALESNGYVLQECPNLLHSCLRNASKAVQTNVRLPDGVSTTWMEWKEFRNPDREILRDMSYFALSPDQKLLVGGKGQCIFLFEACLLGKVEGPFKVMETGGEIIHLEFSPDGRYVFFGRFDRWFSVKERRIRTFPQFSGSLFFVRNVPAEFHNLTKSQSRLSLDGNWTVVNIPDEPSSVILMHKEKTKHGLIGNVLHFAFTDDSNVFLYVTKEKSLHAIHLQTGNILSSMSGLSPLFYFPEKQLGYIFCDQDVERVSFAEHFRSILPSVTLFHPGKTSVKSTFIPVSTILFRFLDAVSTSWKITQEFDVKKCVFSQDGNLIATHKDTMILLFDFSKSLSSLCDDRYHENDVSCLTFSPDSTLLLYFIQSRQVDRTGGLDFYVWDVQNSALSASFDSPSKLLSVDCCCFSSDNTKFIICGEFSIEVWEYASPPCRLLAKVEINVPGLYTEIDKFTHCTVLPKSDLLACCIVDKILLYKLNNPTDPQSILQLPRAHLGKIEFCQFLKGNRYLISYGVDGTVFLWDLSQWKAIAYAKVAQGRESIVGMGVFPEENEVVCLTSLGRTSMLKLCGLVNEMPSTFPTTEAMNRQKMAVANRRHPGEPASSTFESVASDGVEAMDWTKYVEDMNIMADENLESEDDICEGESDE